MDDERKIMVSVRLPANLFDRLDFVARNTDARGIKNRSTAVMAAIVAWLPKHEERLVTLGLTPPKKSR